MAAWPAHAAIAVAQPAMFCEAQAATSCTTTGVTTTNGNLFVASVSYCCDTFTSITDSKSNSYASSALADTADGSGGHVRQDYKDAGTGGGSHTFTLTGASSAFYGSLSVFEVSGAAASPLDKTTIQTEGITASHTSGSTSTTSQADELLIGVGGTISLAVYTTDSGAGWTEGSNNTTDANSEGIITGYRVVSSTGTYAFTYTTDLTVAAVSGISTWKAAAAASTRQRCIGCGIDKKVIGE